MLSKTPFIKISTKLVFRSVKKATLRSSKDEKPYETSDGSTKFAKRPTKLKGQKTGGRQTC